MIYPRRRQHRPGSSCCAASCSLMVVWGALQAVATVFNTADASMGLMATINLVAIVALSGTVVKLTRDYFAQRGAGDRAALPRPRLSRARRPDRPHDLDAGLTRGPPVRRAGGALHSPRGGLRGHGRRRPFDRPDADRTGRGARRDRLLRRPGGRRGGGGGGGRRGPGARGPRLAAAVPAPRRGAGRRRLRAARHLDGPPAARGRGAGRAAAAAARARGGADQRSRRARPSRTTRCPAPTSRRSGVAVDGTLAPGDRDWFAVEVPEGTRGKLVANLVTEEASVTMTLFDDAGQTLGLAATIDEVRVRTATLERGLDRPRFHVLLMPRLGGAGPLPADAGGAALVAHRASSRAPARSGRGRRRGRSRRPGRSAPPRPC